MLISILIVCGMLTSILMENRPKRTQQAWILRGTIMTTNVGRLSSNKLEARARHRRWGSCLINACSTGLPNGSPIGGSW
jgi:hypothetical protein